MIGIVLSVVLAAGVTGSGDDGAAAPACAPVQLSATTVRTWPAADADQGAAADRDHFYAIGNAVIAKHDRKSGALVGRWSGEEEGLVRHLNSCFHDAGRLYCANSNFPQTPMGSSVEIFDAATLAPLHSHSFGMMEEGSLTWLDRAGDGWITGFTHYGKSGGLPYKDNRYSNVVAFDSEWRRVGGWLYPEAILDRMAPYGASGGAIGPDGYLYVLGHDLPEMYVLAAPKMGASLIHIATIAVEAEGQAFSFAPRNERRIFAVDRKDDSRVLEIELPAIAGACAGRAGSFENRQ